MANIQYYERILKTEKTSKKLLPKLLAIGFYAIILSVWFIIMIRVGLTASVVMLIPLSILTAVLLTWKYTSVEYEYSFIGGILTISKIYGKTKRKAIFEAELNTLISAIPYHSEAVESVRAQNVINAIPNKECPNPCVCVFEENEKRTCVIMDCDELTAKILKFFKPSAADRRIFEGIKKQNYE